MASRNQAALSDFGHTLFRRGLVVFLHPSLARRDRSHAATGVHHHSPLRLRQHGAWANIPPKSNRKDALAAVQKGPLPSAALDRLTALRQTFAGGPR